MCGYCFVFIASSSGCESCGPGYWRGWARRAECDGGVNFEGFSRTRGLLGWITWPVEGSVVAFRRREGRWLRGSRCGNFTRRIEGEELLVRGGNRREIERSIVVAIEWAVLGGRFGA